MLTYSCSIDQVEILTIDLYIWFFILTIVIIIGGLWLEKVVSHCCSILCFFIFVLHIWKHHCFDVFVDCSHLFMLFDLTFLHSYLILLELDLLPCDCEFLLLTLRGFWLLFCSPIRVTSKLFSLGLYLLA